MNKVFKCPICLKQFNQSDRSPMTIDSGDVICLKCVNIYQTTLGCMSPIPIAIEKKKLQIAKGLIKHKTGIGNCNQFKQISSRNNDQSHTPIQTQAQNNSNSNYLTDLFYCKLHPNNPIQYYCETDNLALCTICHSHHVKNNHSINQFFPKKAVMITEIEGIAKSIEEEIKCGNRQSSSLSLIRDSLTKYHKDQLQLLTSATEQLMQNILKQKLTIQLQLNNHFNQQLKEVNELLNAISLIETQLTQYKSQCKDYKEKLLVSSDKNGKLVYGDIDNSRREIITNWEQARIRYKNIQFVLPFKISNGQKKVRSVQIRDCSQLHFELITKEINLFSLDNDPINPNIKENIRRRSESIGSVKITSDSTKGEKLKHNKGKRISNPNVHPFKIIPQPQLRQSQSQRVIA